MNKSHTDTITKVIQKALDRGFGWGLDNSIEIEKWYVATHYITKEVTIDVKYIHEFKSGETSHWSKTFSLPDITDRHNFWKSLCGEKYVCSDCGNELNKPHIANNPNIKPDELPHAYTVVAWQYHMTQYHLIPNTDMKARIAYLGVACLRGLS